MSNKQSSGLEYLIEKLKKYDVGVLLLNLHKEEIKQAKEMEKDQHIKSWETGLMKVDFNEYYNKTYGDDKQ